MSIYLTLHRILTYLREISLYGNPSDDSTCKKHGANMIPVNGLFMFTAMTLGVHSYPEEIHGLKPPQAHCSLQSSFHELVFTLDLA